MEKVLQHLRALRSLNLGMESSFFLFNWCLETIRTPLTYLRITCSTTTTIIDLMLTQSLPHTLQQFHVKLNNDWSSSHIDISAAKLSPRMEALHTFTFVKSFKWHYREEWTFVDILTSSSHMPVLQRMNFSIVINADDLNDINHSALFTDYRHVDVHYAFIIDDKRSYSELIEYIPFASQCHSRQIASATFIAES
ncbi:unnamed protein product [Rotaria sp. Silwood2]|nr:unnamed protein product [Rotaria sp. Silwood2]